jgi:hypothetical protein
MLPAINWVSVFHPLVDALNSNEFPALITQSAYLFNQSAAKTLGLV